MQSVLLYNSALDDNFFIDEFIDGLKPEYRAAICLHLPEDLDTACLLAMLQEEELAATAKSSIKENYKPSHRFDRAHRDGKSSIRTDETKKHESGKWEEKLDTLTAGVVQGEEKLDTLTRVGECHEGYLTAGVVPLVQKREMTA